MITTTKATNVSSHATITDHARAVSSSSAPPHRTVRTDFPYTAHRQSLGLRHARGVDNLQTQKISLGLKAQFPAQMGDLHRHLGFHTEPLCRVVRNRAFAAQAECPSLLRNMTEVRPLGSIPFPGLPRYYGPLRLPIAAAGQVIDSLTALPCPGTTSGLPGSSTDLSARALPNHPGRLDGCLCSLLARQWQASPSLESWPPPDKRNEAESGSLTLGLAPSSSGELSSPSPPTLWAGNRPAARVRLPCTGGRNYMLNEQLTRPTPCQSDRSARLRPGTPEVAEIIMIKIFHKIFLLITFTE